MIANQVTSHHIGLFANPVGSSIPLALYTWWPINSPLPRHKKGLVQYTSPRGGLFQTCMQNSKETTATTN